VNVTNNAWYGNTYFPHQHLEMSRQRIEVYQQTLTPPDETLAA